MLRDMFRRLFNLKENKDINVGDVRNQNWQLGGATWQR